jgi:UDP-N-acetylglucosamine acyltransferase
VTISPHRDAQIHPTAVVDPRATIEAGARIGAYSIVGPEVTVGAAVEIGHHTVLEGRVVLEARVKIGHGALIGGDPQDLKFKPDTPSGVKIGAGTVVREQVTIHRATKPDSWTEIGPECLLLASSHIAHDCRLGARVIVINYAGITGHCDIGDHATIGGLTGLAPFTRVGGWAYIGGCAKVTSDVPPFMIVDGVPATVRGVNVIGLRRGGVSPADRRVLQDAHRLLYRSGLGPARALERMRAELPRTPQVDALIEFVTASRRGVCAPHGGWRGAVGEPALESESQQVF